MTRIVILASGSGSNAENIISYFKENANIKVSHVITNNSKAKVIERCKRLGVNCLILNRKSFNETNEALNTLDSINPDLIVLAGFLLKIPENIVARFPNQIINIHPALLPKYGGKGMYGKYIHEAVVANNEKESGITIHYVNEYYDDGAIIFQAKCHLLASDTSEDVAAKIHELEMTHFPKVIESILTSHD